MLIVFYGSAAVALISSVMVITRANAVHALLYLIVSFFAIAAVFYSLGAPFVAALELIVYAGAIMVLFVFVVMMLNVGAAAAECERRWLSPRTWIGPSILAAVLLGQLAFVVLQGATASSAFVAMGPEQVGIALYGPYLLGVELASFLLLAGLVGAYHLGR
ncbi:MAG: NADH-quinone oxidoreductase subunit J, partial [Planctomycetes bacterium]|nr:NADH-quinone oxidoreductase subunit J [Planctomycetota bacterium]